MVYIGVDPGAGGGIAAINQYGDVIVCRRMPETDSDILDALATAKQATFESVRAVLEKVHSSPQMGVTSAFSFGRSYGAVRMALAALAIPFDDVSPQRWQREIGGLVSSGKVHGNMRGRDKNVTKQRAQQMFPAAHVTHATADALLLAEYARRMATGTVAAAAPDVKVKSTRTELF